MCTSGPAPVRSHPDVGLHAIFFCCSTPRKVLQSLIIQHRGSALVLQAASADAHDVARYQVCKQQQRMWCSALAQTCTSCYCMITCRGYEHFDGRGPVYMRKTILYWAAGAGAVGTAYYASCLEEVPYTHRCTGHRHQCESVQPHHLPQHTGPQHACSSHNTPQQWCQTSPLHANASCDAPIHTISNAPEHHAQQ